MKNKELIFFTLLLLGVPFWGFCCQPYIENKSKSDVVEVDETAGILLFLDWMLDDSVACMSKPRGEVLGYVRYRHKDSDEVTMVRVIKEVDSMYYVRAFSGQTDTLFEEGWIEKSVALGIGCRVYEDNDSLMLYSNPSDSSCIRHVLCSEQLGQKPFLDVIGLNFNTGWVNISIVLEKVNYWGWIPPQSQCANPYTTCG